MHRCCPRLVLDCSCCNLSGFSVDGGFSEKKASFSSPSLAYVCRPSCLAKTAKLYVFSEVETWKFSTSVKLPVHLIFTCMYIILVKEKFGWLQNGKKQISQYRSTEP